MSLGFDLENVFRFSLAFVFVLQVANHLQILLFEFDEQKRWRMSNNEMGTKQTKFGNQQQTNGAHEIQFPSIYVFHKAYACFVTVAKAVITLPIHSQNSIFFPSNFISWLAQRKLTEQKMNIEMKMVFFLLCHTPVCLLLSAYCLQFR